jgi:hypothetical protein
MLHSDRGVAVDHDHVLLRPLDGDLEAGVEVLDGPRVSGFEKLVIHVDHRLALALGREDRRHLSLRDLEVAVVERAQHPHHPHVLAALRVLRDGARLRVDRDVAHLVAREMEVLDGLLVRVADLGVLALGPLVVDHQDGSGAQSLLVDAAVEHLLVEGHHQVRLVAHVADGLRAEADADAAGSLTGASRGLDLGRDDLHGPQTVAHLGADGAEQLAGRLRALTGVAHDLDDLF